MNKAIQNLIGKIFPRFPQTDKEVDEFEKTNDIGSIKLPDRLKDPSKLLAGYEKLTDKQLHDFKMVDVFIIYVTSIKQAKNVQRKLDRMGFFTSLKWNTKYNCYYIGQVLISNDFRNGKKQISWGRKEVEKSKYFKSSLVKYEDFMAI